MALPERPKPCLTKRCYPSERAARRMIRTARLQGFEGSSTLRVYFCDFCDGFHLTHQTTYQPRYLHGEVLPQRLKRMLKDLHRAKHAAAAKGWPTIEHEARIAYMRTELQALLEASGTRENATAA